VIPRALREQDRAHRATEPPAGSFVPTAVNLSPGVAGQTRIKRALRASC